MSSEFFQGRALRKESPRRVLSVLVKNCAPTFADHARKLLDQKLRIGNKTKDPSAPSEIKRAAGQIVVHQVELVNLDICKRLRPDRALDRVDKIIRPFDCDDSSTLAGNLRKIDSRITG